MCCYVTLFTQIYYLQTYVWNMIFVCKRLDIDQQTVVFEEVIVKDNITIDGSGKLIMSLCLFNIPIFLLSSFFHSVLCFQAHVVG